MEQIQKIITFFVNRNRVATRMLVALLISLLIARFFPTSATFKYEFELNKPWRYETVIAPFSFAIQKNEEEINDEISRIQMEAIPFYRLENREEMAGLEVLRENIRRIAGENAPPVDSGVLLKSALKVLEKVYSIGVIKMETDHASLPQNGVLNLMRDKVLEKAKISDFLTLEQAVQAIRKEVALNFPQQEKTLMRAINGAIRYNVVFDQEMTERYIQSRLEKISYSRGMVQEGEMIIAQGNIVTENKHQILVSFRTEFEKRMGSKGKSQLIYLGYVLVIMMVLVIFMVFLGIFAREVLTELNHVVFLLTLIGIMVVTFSAVAKANPQILYAIPFAIVPLVVRNFFGAGVAIQAHVTVMLLSSFVSPSGFEFIVLHFLAGMVAIYANMRVSHWSQFFKASLVVLAIYFIGYFFIHLAKEGQIQSVSYVDYAWLSLNMLLILLAYPLTPVFEKIFGMISDITLVELSDINNPLIKELSIKAPGTFQHSLQVANLAEAAAYAIRAKSLLVKVGALYHDIGKMEHPAFFIENQGGINPHENLSFEESASIIIGHVQKGINLARKHDLPDMVVDFIRTHHGTTTVQYFYQNYLKNFPDTDKQAEEEKFRYPGPLPFSRETAIVMLADTVEAASRSLDHPTAEELDNLVEKLVNQKIEENQLIQSDITFRDVTKIKKVFQKMLKSIYHVRISYPVPEK